MILLISSCSWWDFSRTVKYQVTGSVSTATIKLVPQEGAIYEIYNESLPFSATYDLERGDYVYISAKIVDDSGSITVTIYNQGKIYKTATIDGVNAIATVNGYLE
ncbi:MAG: hypothetical protein APR63_00505 [Desulfuromonas sp. SDB]|nr:MAG: hypothetical protein APR63_00505 [Desulfuromonas sp. SDB]